ncbi:MAG: PilC/PilY family type IV pilus protein, partial [bacterium]|nr:PilC/PilY family type IV pilus protein [bacterium]
MFIAFILLCCSTTLKAATTLTIPQVPLIMSNPIHPQVLILIANSQSMDGNLSGAIMTGSGALSSALSSLDNSSSPDNYVVPAGFTPPVQAADASGNAPYTVTQSGNLVDNGPSRLNNAKAGVTAILNAYMGTTDFGLATYSTSGTSVYNTYVYYMSLPGANFSYTNTMVSGNQYVSNPCYHYLTATSTVLANCTSMALVAGSSNLQNNLYIQVDSSSDDPDINDVLYVGSGYPSVFLTYSGPSPATPFPPNFSLANYNSGGVLINYAKTSSSALSSFGTSPTNAGYVPYSPQVIYSQRGFGYYGSQSGTAGNILVPMTSAGTSPTIASVATAISSFTPYLKPETNSSSTVEIKSIATQSPTAGLLSQANTYMVPLTTTSGGGCPQKKYVILISDGLPTLDLNGKSWPPLGSAAAQGYGVTATFNADGSLKTTNNQALTDAITKIKALATNGIPTFVIGLGAGVNSSLNPQAAASLTAMAVAGGTGNYYPATSPTALVTSLNTILISIQNGAYDISAAAVSSTQINGGTVEYQASFVSNDVPYQDWTGNLTAIQLDPTTGSPTTTKLWQAQSLLDNLVSGLGWQNTRLIATWNPTTNAGTPFLWTNLTTAQKALMQPSDTLGANRVQYLRGNTALEQRNGGVFRNRTHILGDIVNSQGAYVGAPNQPYLTTSYLAFAKAQANRQPMVYVGANDGMLHAFKAVNGVEAFAFIPNAVMANLDNLTFTTYNQSHLY